MKQLKGYWFNAETKEVVDVTHSLHIIALYDNPERFGLTREEIEEAFGRHGEQPRIEGRARRELILKVVRSTSWVRLREYAGREGHYVGVNMARREMREKVLAAFDFAPTLYRFSYDETEVDS